MRLSKLIALLLALCLISVALAEGTDIVSENVEVPVAPADGVDAVGLTTEDEAALPAPVADDAPVFDDSWIDAESAVSAPQSGLWYAGVTAVAPLVCDTLTHDVLAELGEGEVVLVTGEWEGWQCVAANIGSGIVEGFMDGSDLAPLGGAEVAGYQDAATASDGVALYNGDLNWPLCPLGSASRASFSVMASNYTEYNNDTVFKINGKEVSAGMVPDTGSGNCWRWAQGMYKIIWGVNFNEKFKGTAATGMNMLRDLGDEERRLTPEHLKAFVMQTQPGATIRVCGCTSKCGSFDNDGLACGHKGHSLIIADKNADGVITLDSHSGSQHTRFYSWQGFCNSWKNYTYIKYIKWPNAPALAPEKSIDGYAVTDCSDTWRVRATAKSGASVYSKPSEGSVVATLVYPDTFNATRVAVKTIGGKTWVYGSTAKGESGWLPVTDDVAKSTDAIAVTGVAMDREKLLLIEGGSATISAVIAPADATNTKLSWSSDNLAVASAEDGVIRGIASGTTTVTVTTKDGKKTAACTVKVVPAQGTKKLSKTGSNGTVKMYPGQKLQLVPTFATKKGWKLKSATSSKTKVATLDKTGIVTSKAAGKTKITVKTKNGKKATLTIQVIDPFEVTGVKLSKTGTLKLKKGATKRLYAKLTPATAISKLTWKTSNAAVATIDQEGNITAKKKGTCYVGAIAENGVYKRIKVKVS